MYADEVLRLADRARRSESVARDDDRARWGGTAAGDADQAMQYFSGTY